MSSKRFTTQKENPEIWCGILLKRFPLMLLLALLFSPLQMLWAQDAQTIIQGAIDHWRDTSSVVESRMVIHREDWERTFTLRSYTRGDEQSLVRFLYPPRDAGNASLTLDKVMWNYVPRIKKTIKIPPSMMGQSWMGSDFSYRDLAREDAIIDDYTHTLLKTETSTEGAIYTIEAIPRPHAAVVWGKEVLEVREDHIILSHQFYDQDMKLIKQLTSEDIGTLGGKVYPKRMRMTRLDENERWTEIVNEKALFSVAIPASTFTLANLRNPRESFLKELDTQ